MSRVQLKFVDVESGLDAALAPLPRVAALLAALQKAVRDLPGTVAERDLERVTKILNSTFGKAEAADLAAAPPWAPAEVQTILAADGQLHRKIIQRGMHLRDVGVQTKVNAEDATCDFEFTYGGEP